eukprot:Nitzschia sp. Nitz4//scaffold48_size128905//119719//120624//NITZ4_003622-RA/size128905-snap-gene-0.65-mRNA-1//-1//CDS//3329553048//7295//frame0
MSSVSRTDANNQTGSSTDFELDIHPTSKWEETAREDELTLWEVHRRPRAQECPSCRKPIPSRRSLRRDKKFDDIINGMMGTAQDRQHTEEVRGLEDAKHIINLQKAIVSKKQMDRSKLPKPCASGGDSANTTSKHKTIVGLEIPSHIHIELRRHPEETTVDRLKRPFLTLRNDVKISFLKGFLKKKLEDREYELTSKLDDESVVLDDKLTLADTKNALFPTRSQKSILVLKYRVPDDDDSEELDQEL